MTTRSLLLATLVVGTIAVPSSARAGSNPGFTVPLHAMEAIATSCRDYLPVDCFTHRPVVNIPPDQTTTVFVFVANHYQLHGLQTAFIWGPQWSLVFSHFDCQVRQLNLTVPANPGGSSAGAIVTAFDCVTNLALQVIGYMVFDVGPQGCLTQINPDLFPSTVAALDCDLLLDEIDASHPVQQARLGRICVGPGGVDACDVIMTAVESATWGRIKATQR